MSTTTMHFGPEWMRTKHQPLPRSQPPPSPPPANAQTSAGLSTYSALVSAIPPAPSDSTDEAHPFRYSKEELIKFYQEGAGKGGLGLEVERWEGVVREAGAEPVALREMTEAEKKLFASPLNSEMRRRPSQSVEFLSPLTTSGLDRPRLTHNTSSTTTHSPLRERFGGLKRRDSTTGTTETAVPTVLRKPSLSALQAPALSPREAPRPRVGYTPSFDGVLNSGEAWMTRRRVSETPTRSGANLSREDSDGRPDHITLGIREEKGEGLRVIPDSRMTDGTSTIASSSPQVRPEEPRLYAAATMLASETENPLHSSSAISASVNGTVHVGGDFKDIGPPPGLVDLASVEWSYKDPTGQVQGPFRADLMQKWYNDGYFSSDLPMKRVRYDVQWTTVAQLLERTKGENIFLSPTPLSQPVRLNGSPSQILPPSDHAINEPFQPAPIRSLRPSALESYLSTASLASDSPSSSVGGSHFGNPSPDPSTFGGRDNQAYLSNDINGRLSTFGGQDRPLTFSDRRSVALDYQGHPVHNMRGQSSGGFGPERDLAFSAYPYNPVPIPHDSWVMSPNTPSSAFIGIHDQDMDRSFSLSNPLQNEPGPGHPQSESVGESLSRTYDRNVVFTNENTGDFLPKHSAHGDLSGLSHGHYDTTSPASFSKMPDLPMQYAPPVGEYIDDPSSLYSFGQNVEPLPDPSALPSSIPTTSWKHISDSSPSHSLEGQKELLHTTATSAGPSLSSQFSWLSVEHESTSAQADVVGTQSVLREQDASLKTEIGSFSAGVLSQQSQPQVSSRDIPPQKTDDSAQSQPPSEAISGASAPISGHAVAKKAAKALQADYPVIQPATGESVITSVAQKTAWAKEEEGRRKAGTNVSISLREIQEAEAKKLETRKAAEREKERLARISAVVETAEDAQPFTASWGLPTSQAGIRGSFSVRDAATNAGSAPPAAPVWTTAPKQPVVKKTMKEIQEEEEIRKKMAARENLPSVAPKRPYAETTTKITPANNAWTTVGPNGKSSAAAVNLPQIRPSAQPSGSLSTSASKATSSPTQKFTINAVAKTKPLAKNDETSEVPSHDFLKWLSDSLKGLNASVNVEEIVSMLLSFPLDPDASTMEIISDTIYSNSTTLDGRRFASEFVTKRKADAAARKGASMSGKAPLKPISIADVVKATPKAPQPEWGFKVVNKKKKGGRS